MRRYVLCSTFYSENIFPVLLNPIEKLNSKGEVVKREKMRVRALGWGGGGGRFVTIFFVSNFKHDVTLYFSRMNGFIQSIVLLLIIIIILRLSIAFELRKPFEILAKKILIIFTVYLQGIRVKFVSILKDQI